MYTLVKDLKDFIVVSKHPGVRFHRDTGPAGLVEAVRAGLGRRGLYAVHRLDAITSGLLVLAGNREAAKILADLFRRGDVEKYYLAISDRRPRKKQGLIKGDMVKARRGAWRLTRTMHQPAVTQFFSYPLGGGLRLFVLRPRTGKTHQLRVALKSIGAPVLGDPVYHRKGEAEPDRGYLHSYALKFIFRGESHTFVHPPDEGLHFTGDALISALEKCRRPWELPWPSVK